MSQEIGWVYLMRNASMPGIVKVGHTFDDPWERANQLSNSTSVPTPFVVIFSQKTKFPDRVEKAVHHLHRDTRVSKNREFFYSSVRIHGPGADEKRMADEGEENEWWIQGIKQAAKLLRPWMDKERAEARYKQVVAFCNWQDKELLNKFQLQYGGVA